MKVITIFSFKISSFYRDVHSNSFFYISGVDLSEEAIEFRRKINASIELYFKNKKTKTDKDYLNSIFDQAEKVVGFFMDN